MPLRMRWVAWGLVAASLLVGVQGHAYSFGDLALISPTMGANAGRLCIGDTAPDIGCPTNAPYLNSGGLLGIGTTNPQTALEVSGTVSATHFVGDGSGLTGVVASTADRIVSGTTSMVAVSATGYVSLTQAGTNTGWFDPTRGLVTLGVSATGPISGTAGYFSGNVGIGTNSPYAPISGTFLEVSGTSGVVSVRGTGTTGSAEVDFDDSSGVQGAVGWGNSGSTFANRLYLGTVGANPVVFLTSAMERARIDSSGRIGVGTSTPTAKLDVIGTISASNVYVTATTGTVSGTYGYFKYISATNLSGNIATDRISTSGVASGATLGMAVADKGTVSFTLGGTAGAAYLHPTLGFVGPGVSTTGGISGTTGYFSSYVNVGTISPSTDLDVAVGTGGVYTNAASTGEKYVSWNINSDVQNDSRAILYFNHSNTPKAAIYTAYSTGSSDVLGLTLRTMTNTPISFQPSSSEAMRILSNGNVGIGTTNPSYALDVTTTASIVARFGNGGNGRNLVIDTGSASLDTYGVAGASTASIWHINRGTPSQSLVINPEGTGKVGIGTTSNTVPAATLQVSGSMIVSTTGQNTTPSLYVGTTGAIGLGTNAPTQQLTLKSAGPDIGLLDTTSGATNTIDNTGGALTFNTGGGNSMFFQLGGSEKMRINTGTGNVGIGTTAPSATLHVSGTMFLKRYTAQPVACSASYNGMVALTSTTIAICNGSNWVLDRTNTTFTW